MAENGLKHEELVIEKKECLICFFSGKKLE